MRNRILIMNVNFIFKDNIKHIHMYKNIIYKKMF